ncbi:MAG: efflux RND transporter periplasmic adaptor subunit [Desulfopila sp.]|jgi:RND family efflux transporter MFP subunit|nr:efflux RND transporter periplasmic adaptor subunit [Desulfopila sp.]
MSISTEQQKVPGEVNRAPSRLSKFVMHFLMPVAALSCGIIITVYLLHSRPQALPVKRVPTAVLVEVEQLSSGPQQTVISAMGEIIPAREIELKPQVSGEIAKISENFQLGGYLRTGEELLTVDRTNYELVLRQLQSDVATVESDLALEMGNQRIAEREITLLEEEVSVEEQSLILRRPQLAKLKAVRDDALARLERAQLDLERTVITAPFNGAVAEKLVDIGTKVGETTTLAKIVGTDTFWLRLTLPVEQLKWIEIPENSSEKGSRVTIYPQGDSSASLRRSGEVVRLIASLEEQGRMAQLLVKIDDPLSLKEENRAKPKLLLGSYVTADIAGIAIDSGYRIDRSNLRDGDTVWLMDENGNLDIRPVEVLYRGRNSVIVTSGIQDSENIIVSSLSAPVAGTALRLSEGENTGTERIADRDSVEKNAGRTDRVN